MRLIHDMGDRDILPQLAEREGWDLQAAMEELRGQQVLDERHHDRLRLITELGYYGDYHDDQQSSE